MLTANNSKALVYIADTFIWMRKNWAEYVSDCILFLWAVHGNFATLELMRDASFESMKYLAGLGELQMLLSDGSKWMFGKYEDMLTED